MPTACWCAAAVPSAGTATWSRPMPISSTRGCSGRRGSGSSCASTADRIARSPRHRARALTAQATTRRTRRASVPAAEHLDLIGEPRQHRDAAHLRRRRQLLGAARPPAARRAAPPGRRRSTNSTVTRASACTSASAIVSASSSRSDTRSSESPARAPTMPNTRASTGPAAIGRHADPGRDGGLHGATCDHRRRHPICVVLREGHRDLGADPARARRASRPRGSARRSAAARARGRRPR